MSAKEMATAYLLSALLFVNSSSTSENTPNLLEQSKGRIYKSNSRDYTQLNPKSLEETAKIVDGAIARIVSSNVLNDDYLKGLQSLNFILRPDSSAADSTISFNGQYWGDYNAIILTIPPIYNLYFQYLNYDKYSETIIHEAAHDFWKNHMLPEKKQEFAQKVVQLANLIKKYPDSLEYAEKFGMNYHSFGLFENTMDLYPYYSVRVEEGIFLGFFGNETFARLATTPLMLELNRNMPDGFSVKDYMHSELFPYYEGFFNDRFFTKDPNKN